MLSLAAMCTVGGCSMAPAYQRPAVALPATLGQSHATVAAVMPEQELPLLTAQERGFIASLSPDHDLAPLLRRALAHNADYRLAGAQVEQARAQYRIERAARLPSIGVQAQGNRQHFDDSAMRERYQQKIDSAGVGVSGYELDFFGRLKSLSGAAAERFLASGAGREAARGALVAEVLRTWALYGFAVQARAQWQAIDADSAALLAIATRQAQNGLISRDQLQQQRLRAEQANLVARQASDQVAALRRALQLLAAYPAQVEPATLLAAGQAMPALRDLSSQILLQRPDIRQAEAELRAANADIGAARAAFFPMIRLSTSIGSASSALDGLFRAGSGMWSFVPELLLPVFDAGRNRANLDLAWTRKHAGVIAYEKTIEAAFRAVGDALDARQTLALGEQRLREQDRLAGVRIERAARRTAQGLGARQDLLAERIDAGQLALDYQQARRDLVINRIALFQAFYGVDLPISL